MRPALALLLLGLSVASPGCALVEDVSRNFCVSLSRPIAENREYVRAREWADEAWQRTGMMDGLGRSSGDYANGFEDGFAEYLYRGGDGEPPLLPPPHYRHLRNQSPEGYQAAQDWFAG